jgi:hypothetical protein
MDGAIPTPPSKNTPKLPTPHPSSPNNLPTYLPIYIPTYFPTYSLSLSLFLSQSSCLPSRPIKDRPTNPFKTTYLTLFTISKSYPPSPPTPLSLSLCQTPIYTYLLNPSYLPTYLLYLPSSSEDDQSVAY